ncbi:hypothetical protein L204_100105 [Cryptococcus depauperatus]|nr:hypothetical protein L204_02413 [Cryptococcus depauperatus CBS 7855]
MSDNRKEAEEGLNVIQDLEDSLGSALEDSFNTPPATKPAVLVPSQIKEEIPVATLSESVPGMDEWPKTYQNYVSGWQAESAVAREKAEATRKRFEDESTAETKAKQKDGSNERKKALDEEERKKDEERIRIELEGEEDEVQGAKGHHDKKKVREAWELVGKKDEGEQKSVSAVTASGHSDPIPPVFQNPKPIIPQDVPSESATLSRRSATSQAWEEISGQSSGSGEKVSSPRSTNSDDLVKVPSPQKTPNVPLPPTQPPSLTLTLFTNAKSLSISRVFAVVGINLVLPFINGVMLGFGEIFAREVVKVGKSVWRGEKSLFNFGQPLNGLGGRGTTGVGLSGGRF